jgi:ferric iron reductase protein FhuF
VAGNRRRAVRQPLIRPAERQLRDAARLGPFFTVRLPGAARGDLAWHRFEVLSEPAGVALLAERISELSRLLGTDQRRPVASILHLGAASAICAPLLATAAIAGSIPPLQQGRLRFGFEANGPLQLALDDCPPDGPPGLLPHLADQLIDVALSGLLAPFTRALTETAGVPANTLRGNVFSALAAAARLITPAASGVRARALVDLLARRHPPLRGAGTLNWRATEPSMYFRRRNCCLFYRIPGGGICGDCVLTT